MRHAGGNQQLSIYRCVNIRLPTLGGNMIQVNITGDIVAVVSDDNFTDDEWMSVLRQHNLLDRPIDFIDYQMDDYDVPVPLHRWTLHFAPVNTTVQESA